MLPDDIVPDDAPPEDVPLVAPVELALPVEDFFACFMRWVLWLLVAPVPMLVFVPLVIAVFPPAVAVPAPAPPLVVWAAAGNARTSAAALASSTFDRMFSLHPKLLEGRALFGSPFDVQ